MSVNKGSSKTDRGGLRASPEILPSGRHVEEIHLRRSQQLATFARLETLAPPRMALHLLDLTLASTPGAVPYLGN